jgi:alkylation response protein AidB-like acyl-CoA dehydrogenase
VDVNTERAPADERRDLRDRLAAAVAVRLPAPGSGWTGERFHALSEIARNDLELARLAEAHHDAHAIASDLGVELADGLYGVWAATGSEPLVATPDRDGYCISGVVPWCTGIGIVDRALVAAKTVAEDGTEHGLLIDLGVGDGVDVAAARPWVSPAFASAGTGSLRFEAMVPPACILGAPDSYFGRPGFWHGAIGVAACWSGGLRGLVDLYTNVWRRSDGHSLALLASASAWANAIESVLAKAASDIDKCPDDTAIAEARARSVRHVVERACTMAMDDFAVGAGPEPLAFDLEIIARTQQLQLYIRQCHGPRDMEPLGRYLLNSRTAMSKGV